MNEQFKELRLAAVSRHFDNPSGARVAALHELTLTIGRGEFICLLGPSGCGKTTALNCIAGLLPVTGGTISLDERRIDLLPPEKRGFGMVFQNYALFPHMTVRRNVAFGLMMRGTPAAEMKARVARAFELVQLTGHEDKLPGQLSGGQQQRVAIARAIVIEPPLLLMDEPLSNLDAKLRLEMRAEIRRIHRQLGRTTIYVTHDQDEALSLADRIVVMKDGLVQQVAGPEEVYAQPANLHVARFMGYRNVLALNVGARNGDQVTLEGSGLGLEGIAKQELGGPRASVAIRPGGSLGRQRRAERDRRQGRERRIRRTRFADRCARRAGHRAACARDRAPQGRRRREAHRRAAARAGLSGGERMNAHATARSGWGADTLLLVGPAVLFLLLFFVYPFAYGFWLSFTPAEGTWLANYDKFFSDEHLWRTLIITFQLALPVTILNVALALPIAFQLRRKTRYQRWMTAILVIPITLGTVLIAEGMLTYLGPKGWLAQFLSLFHVYDGPDPADAQLHRRGDLAGHLGLPVRVPADPLLRHRHRSGAGARRRDARRKPVRPVPPHLSAAARARARDHVLPRLRAGFLGVSLRRAGRRAVGADAGDLARRL